MPTASMGRSRPSASDWMSGRKAIFSGAFMSVPLWIRPDRSAELGRELFGDRAGQGVGDHVHVLAHRLPGLRLFGVLLVLQLPDLLDVVPTMREQQSIQGVERQIGVGSTEELGDLGGVAGQVLERSVLPGRVAGDARLEV